MADSPVLPPSRPEAHRVGDVGETSVALQLKRWGWTADLIESDYGEDLDCTVFVNGKKTAFHFRCQVKSTSSNKSQIRRLKSGDFSVSVSSSVCLSWAESFYPVILTIYDDLTGKIYWGDATQLARIKASNLKSQTVSFRVPSRELILSQEQLASDISRFYSNLLNLSSSEYTCSVVPVLMPKMRSYSHFDFYIPNTERFGDSLQLEPSFVSYEHSPSWITSVKSMNGTGLLGWDIKATASNLDQFFEKLKEFLLRAEFPVKENEWLAFIVSPVKFQEKAGANHFWAKDLTGWSSYSVINGTCFSDFNYSFLRTDDFLQQIARRARSWDGVYSVDTKLDIAVQVYSEQATTPAYREFLQRQRQQTLGKFLPWICKSEDLGKLTDHLESIGLVFRICKSDELFVDSSSVKGIICVPLFWPEEGLVPQSKTWDELETGDVNHRLSEYELIDKLPGYRGDEDITNFVMTVLRNNHDFEVPEAFLIDESKYVEGMPLEHNGRQVLFQKFTYGEKRGNNFLKKAQSFIEKKVENLLAAENAEFDVCIEMIETFSEEPVCCTTVSIKPALFLSTEEFVERFKAEVAQVFIGAGLVSSASQSTTLNILKTHGEIYFAGDSPWGNKHIDNNES